MSHPSFIEHLKSLGVTAIELLPVHAFISEQFLTAKGLQNYWGYNSLNFFTPHKDYLVNDDINEFKQMVSELHRANIEVILDVVYNHTAEGGNDGPILSLRGLDNLTYYRTPLFTEKLSQCVAITTTQKYVKYWAKLFNIHVFVENYLYYKLRFRIFKKG